MLARKYCSVDYMSDIYIHIYLFMHYMFVVVGVVLEFPRVYPIGLVVVVNH